MYEVKRDHHDQCDTEWLAAVLPQHWSHSVAGHGVFLGVVHVATCGKQVCT
jgi:hypothetical protein